MKSPVSPLKLDEIIKSGQLRPANMSLFTNTLNDTIKTPAESIFKTPDGKTNIFKINTIQDKDS
jgi:hypothetical protein